MQVVVRQHPFYFEVQSVPFLLQTVVGKKKTKKREKQERKGKTLESRAAIIMI